jgi:hypothetical protein
MCFPICKTELSECTISGRPIPEAVVSNIYPILLMASVLAACATKTVEQAAYDPLQDYAEVDAATILDAPAPVPGSFAPEHLYQVERGEYLVELLGCGACHTDGALDGVPDFDRALAGSRIGIAYSNPLRTGKPGVIYPANLTPDEETGIGKWSDHQVTNAVRAGIGRHGNRRIPSMPWQGYARLTDDDDDVDGIVAYLRSIKPISNRVPKEVKPGSRAIHPFVYFGVYRSN